MNLGSLIKKTASNFFIVLIVCSCSQNRKNGIDLTANTTKDTITTMQSKPVITVTDNDSMFYRKLEKGIPLIIKGNLKGVGMPIKIFLEIADGDSIHAVLEATEKDAVIRISQIIFPDKTADGPFGRSLDYPIKQYGTYILVLGDNLMAEGNTKTAFTLNVSLF